MRQALPHLLIVSLPIERGVGWRPCRDREDDRTRRGDSHRAARPATAAGRAREAAADGRELWNRRATTRPRPDRAPGDTGDPGDARHLTSHADVVITLTSATGEVVMRRADGIEQRFTPGPRAFAHVRHWNKYAEGSLPQPRHFHFRDARGLTGHAAGNVPDFMAVVGHTDRGVLRHHAGGGDFSRWLGDIFRNATVTRALRGAEARFLASEAPTATTAFRAELQRIAEDHLAGHDGAPVAPG